MSRHPFFDRSLTSAQNLRLGALVLVLATINQIDDPLVDPTIGQDLVYWVVRTGVLAAGLWLAAAFVANRCNGRWDKPAWLKPVIIVSALALAPLAITEILIEPHLPMRPEFQDDELWAYSPPLAILSEYATLASIVVPIHFLLWLIIDRVSHMRETPTEGAPLRMPAFLNRLPAVSPANVLAMQAEEHYVRIFTLDGAELVQYRFKDAVDEMPKALGLRVHRSWWVAGQAVRAAHRGSRRWQLEIANDVVVPVSDSYVKAVREAGWLKRKPKR